MDGFEPRIRELLTTYPTMPATVIAERIGWPYSIRTLSGRIAQLRPWYLPADPAGRTSYEPDEIAQCDFWFPAIVVPVGFGYERTAKQLPVLTMVTMVTMVTGYARWSSAVLVPSRGAPDLYAGWCQLIAELGAVPRVLVWDGEGAVGRWRRRQPELTGECHGLHGTLGAKVIICKSDNRRQGPGGTVPRLSGHRFCPAARLAHRLISTVSCRDGFSGRTLVSTGCWVAGRWIASTPIVPRCWPCRRWPR